MNCMYSDTADVANISSSSFSSAMSSGMVMAGRSTVWYSSSGSTSSDRNRRSDSGDMSLDLLDPDDLILRVSSVGVGALISGREEELCLRPNNRRGENQLEPGELDLAERLSSGRGAVAAREAAFINETTAGCGVLYLSFGFMVM